ncbi:MAG: MFS transporter [Promethearchaeota archaeon]
MKNEIIKPEFKKSYPFIFSFFYLVQGLYNGLQAIVLPIYLITVVERIDLALILIILSIGVIPWSVKFLIGMANDKYSTRYGRRKPWIFIFGIWGGIWFIIAGILLPQLLGLETSTLIMFVAFFALCWNIGWAVCDTALDGLILDVTPKEDLGKVQGYTWSMNLFGSTAGGIIIGVLVLMFDLFTFFFVLEGILLFIACIFPFYIKESELPEDIHVWDDLKEIMSEGKNWKLFILSILDSIPYAVVTLAYGLLIIIYWPIPLVEIEITSISLSAESLDLFMIFAIFGAIGGIGVILGCTITGRISDKSRKKGVYFAHIIYIPFVIICVLFSGVFFGGNVAIVLAIIMTILLGIGEGSLTTSFQAVRGDFARHYPDSDSTFYALVISCLNAGQMIGFALAGFLLIIFSNIFTEFWVIFLYIMLIMAGIQMASFGIFLTIDSKEYEFIHNIKKTPDKKDEKSIK